jgi:hypothetical protein
MFRKNKLAMLVGEFLGTAALTLAVLAVSHSQLSLNYFIASAAIYQRFPLYAKAAAIGGALMSGSLIASLGSAGVLNPAVALGLHQWGWGTYVLGPVLGAVIGFNLYNLLFVETELAEVATGREAKAGTSKLNATLTQSEVATEVDANVNTASAKGRNLATALRAGVATPTLLRR